MFTVEDLRDMNESQFKEFGVVVSCHAHRIAQMLQGNPTVRDQFAFATSAQAEGFFLQFYGGDNTSSDVLDATATHSSELRQYRASQTDAVELTVLAKKFGRGIPRVTVSVAQIMKHCATYWFVVGHVIFQACLPALSLRLLDLHSNDPAGAVEAVTDLVKRLQEPIVMDPAVAAGLVKTEDDEVDAMPLRYWLTRLGLQQYHNSMLQHNLQTAGDLRAKLDSLESMGVQVCRRTAHHEPHA